MWPPAPTLAPSVWWIGLFVTVAAETPLSVPLARIAEAMNRPPRSRPLTNTKGRAEHTAELVRAMAPQDSRHRARGRGRGGARLLPRSGEQLVGLTDLSGWQGYRFDLVGFEDRLTAKFEAGHETIHLPQNCRYRALLLYMNHRFRSSRRTRRTSHPTQRRAQRGALVQPGRALLGDPGLLKDHDRLPNDHPAAAQNSEGMDPFRFSRVSPRCAGFGNPARRGLSALRNARMEEMGFPPLEEAVVLFAGNCARSCTGRTPFTCG